MMNIVETEKYFVLRVEIENQGTYYYSNDKRLRGILSPKYSMATGLKSAGTKVYKNPRAAQKMANRLQNPAHGRVVKVIEVEEVKVIDSDSGYVLDTEFSYYLK